MTSCHKFYIVMWRILKPVVFNLPRSPLYNIYVRSVWHLNATIKDLYMARVKYVQYLKVTPELARTSTLAYV